MTSTYISAGGLSTAGQTYEMYPSIGMYSGLFGSNIISPDKLMKFNENIDNYIKSILWHLIHMQYNLPLGDGQLGVLQP